MTRIAFVDTETTGLSPQGHPRPRPDGGRSMNARLIAGVAILALMFGAWFVGIGLDEGWLVAAATTMGGIIIGALGIVAVKLICDGLDEEAR